MNQGMFFRYFSFAFLGIVLSSTMLASTEAASSGESYTFRVMTFNVCNPVEVQKSPELMAKFSWGSRWVDVCAQIRAEAPDLIGIQEGRDEPGRRSSMADFWDGLGTEYDIQHYRNNASVASFLNIIAGKKDRLFMDKSTRWWASATPDVFSDTWGNGWV